jgi:hypothetical protein
MLSFLVVPSWAQHTQGRINVIVLDPQGAVVLGAKLELQDLATNDVRTAETQSGGTYSFVNLPAGKYKLKVSKEGFRTAVYEVVVETARTADVEAKLELGAVTQVVEVGAVAPVMDVTQNAIGTVIDLRHIENLPITGRNIRQLATLTPGYTGTWNGLPTIAQSSNIDGVQQGPTRMKYSGMPQSVEARLENIEEMTVQTDQLDMNQGFGQGAMQINFTTRRGTNDFHGMAFWDYRNDNLNANSWSNNMRGIKRPEFKLNDFGGNIGGPILKDKLFFFVSLSTARQPGATTRSSSLLVSAAQSGRYTYVGTDGQTRTIDLFAVAQAYNTANGTSLPTSLNSVISSQFTRINTAVQQGTLSTTTNPNINTVSWLSPDPRTWWYPAFRVDYTPFQNLRMNLAFNRTWQDRPTTNAPYFPGDDFTKWVGGSKFDGFTASYGIDWTISPTLLNSFKFGYLYNANFFGYNATREYINNPTVIWFPMGLTTPQNYYRPVTSSYPVFNISDTATWQKSAHTVNFGFTFYREYDRYWNPPEGIAEFSLGLVNGDPALTAFTNAGAYQPLPFASTSQQSEAQSLYALLTGRVSNIFGRYAYNPKTGDYFKGVSAYNLAELSKAWSLFIQDSWRIRPDLTINAGLRWDFTGNNVDLTGAYHNLDESSLYGPSGVGNLFKPGTLTGNMNPTFEARSDAYNAWNVTPQPALGIAWNPRFQNGILQKLFGDGDTVFRTSFSLRRFTVPYQYYWDNASAYGSFFYQFFSAQPGTGGTGYFPPGSLSLGQPLPALSLSPATYVEAAPLTTVTTFIASGPPATGIKHDIGQPYTMSWTFGIQRQLGSTRAIEIRYNGNRTIKQWIAVDLNEVNVFENGFLQDFLHAQANMAICQANAAACLAAQAAAGVPASSQTTSSFANWGLTGQTAIPIITAAFTGSQTGPQTNSNFRGSTFITYLNTGAVGSFAQLLVRGSSAAAGGRYFCNLVGGAAFSPCGSNPGAGYPINFFVANPFAIRGTGDGFGASYMTDAGWSNYHALQVDFRQRLWHGIQFNANYTWSHTLGVSTPDDWTAGYYAYTLRDLKHSYGPTRFDVRHVLNIAGTVDLPFGRGRKWLNRTGVVDKLVGGWTIGTITIYRTGFPFRVLGGYLTYNNLADGGVVLTGVTRDELQKAIGVYKTPGQTFVSLIDPKYRTIGVGANTTYIKANTTPGTFAPPLWLYGPHGFYCDIMVSKTIPINERWQFNFQTQFLNAFNHPVFGQGTTPIGGNVRSSGWGTVTGQSNSPRVIEFRAKISF